MSKPTRREVIKQAAMTLAAASTLTGCARQYARAGATASFGKGTRLVFQGDSITDGGRQRQHEEKVNDARALGVGYALLAASSLLADHPEAGPRIYNRGISGHKVFQLAARWDKDCLDLKPDVLSILIGVNDIWHTRNGTYEGTVDIYERDYRRLLERTRSALPAVKLIVCEPFVLRCGAVEDSWFPEFDEYRGAAQKLAGEFGATFVAFQSIFDEAVAYAPPEYWAADGVHPTLAGSQLMAQTWLHDVLQDRQG
ncbi:SGNH/GDSL hydrolase family protein [Planctomycetota bacterium]